ncbi:copper chaperone PCu(A)C [Stakelama marina]|uniref:Copper chaperone PCu(A)C n=1 Tax=Stakelama marina TaxID=2826939 RepID=A0A8T4IBV3_9SPHN|nr:copper chaperone PCu(A)C [Stakelama marina]MBR0552137.1 copper chaperone PCu(A)C [Stakelama marina]
MRLLALLALPVLLASCSHPAELSADQAWIRLPAVKGRPAAAYFTMHGGKDNATLLAAATPIATRAELHQSMRMDTGKGTAMDTMKPIANVAVPAGETVKFEPGGKHVMLFDISPKAKPGNDTRLSLSFAGGRTLEIPAKLVAAGDPSPY